MGAFAMMASILGENGAILKATAARRASEAAGGGRLAGRSRKAVKTLLGHGFSGLEE